MHKYVFWLLGIFSVAQAVTFTDQANIPSWGVNAVNQLVTAEVISGNDDGSLAPWRSINRAEFLKILTTATEANIVANSGANFPDVAVNAWFSPYVHTAVANGWAKGYPDGTFKPGNLINRAEIAKLISEAWDLPLTIKAQDQNWYEIYVRALAEADRLPYGATSNQFDPAKNPSRIEVFEQLFRTWESAQSEADIVLIPAIEEEADTSLEDETLDVSSEASAETEETGIATEASGENPAEMETSTETAVSTETPAVTNGSGEASTETETTVVTNPETELPETEADTSQLGLTNLSPSTTQIIYPGQGGISPFSVILEPLQDTPVIRSLTITHEGNAPITNFSRMWITDGSERISQEIVPDQIENIVQFEPALSVSGPMQIYLKLDTPSAAEHGYTSRWVITAIDSTTDLSQITLPINGQWMEMHPE